MSASLSRLLLIPLLSVGACAAPAEDEPVATSESPNTARPLQLACPVAARGVLGPTATWSGAERIASAQGWSPDDYKGTGTSIAVDAERVRVAYYSSEHHCRTGRYQLAQPGVLFLASRGASGWTRSALVCDERGYKPAIAPDGSGGLHIAFASEWSEWSDPLHVYGRWTETSFRTSLLGAAVHGGSSVIGVAVTSDCAGAPVLLAAGKVFTPGDTSASTPARFDVFGRVPDGRRFLARDASGRLHAASNVWVARPEGGSTGRARYAGVDGTTWGAPEDPTGGAGGDLVGMDVGTDGAPRVLYASSVGAGLSSLVLATRAGASWTRKEMWRGWLDRGGASVAFALDGADEPFAILQGSFARVDPSTGAWKVSDVGFGSHPSMVIDASGVVHAASMRFERLDSNGTAPGAVLYHRFGP